MKSITSRFQAIDLVLENDPLLLVCAGGGVFLFLVVIVLLRVIKKSKLKLKDLKAKGYYQETPKDLLDLKIKNQSKCSDVLSKTEEKIQEIKKKISDLNKMKKSLEGLANCCVDRDQPLSDCPILDCFMPPKDK